MREAMIIVPKADNDGRDMLDVQRVVATRLVKAFGGATIREAFGAWEGPDGQIVSEPVWEVIAACEPDYANEVTLRLIARYVGEAARQWAVYMRHASGEVEIMDTSVLAGLKAA